MHLVFTFAIDGTIKVYKNGDSITNWFTAEKKANIPKITRAYGYIGMGSGGDFRPIHGTIDNLVIYPN